MGIACMTRPSLRAYWSSMRSLTCIDLVVRRMRACDYDANGQGCSGVSRELCLCACMCPRLGLLLLRCDSRLNTQYPCVVPCFLQQLAQRLHECEVARIGVQSCIQVACSCFWLLLCSDLVESNSVASPTRNRLYAWRVRVSAQWYSDPNPNPNRVSAQWYSDLHPNPNPNRVSAQWYSDLHGCAHIQIGMAHTLTLRR